MESTEKDINTAAESAEEIKVDKKEKKQDKKDLVKKIEELEGELNEQKDKYLLCLIT